MKAAIYYFSATGNSLVVARDLAKELDGAIISPIVKALARDDLSDIVAVVFPVYMFGLPLIVAEFLKKLELKPSAYIFTVATFGGLAGRAHSMAKEILRNRGIELAAGFSVRMPGNYTPLSGAIPAEKQEELFKKEKLKIPFIAKMALQKNRGIFEEKPFLPNLLLFKMLYRAGSSQIPLSAKGFWITDACTKCGFCIRVCPVINIESFEGKPKWLDHCQHCLACLQWCPVEAIQYKNSTLKKKRYHNPAVLAQEIIIPGR
ncbi:MAG: EFR1 family ferrodoxin [Candidatus Omnitrophota bacterium]